MLIGNGITIRYHDAVFTGATIAEERDRHHGYAPRPSAQREPLSEYEVIRGWFSWLPIELTLVPGHTSALFDLRMKRWEPYPIRPRLQRCYALQLVSYHPQIAQAPHYRLIYAPDDEPLAEISGVVTIDFGELGLWFQVVPNRFWPQATADLPMPAGWSPERVLHTSGQGQYVAWSVQYRRQPAA